MAKLFVLYDARARGGDPDDAAVLVTENSASAAKTWRGDWPSDSVWFEYDVAMDGKTLVNPKLRHDIKC